MMCLKSGDGDFSCGRYFWQVGLGDLDLLA
jgi:hypothetical protein